MAIRPLPRSLDPLPDESLVGFLLRLSHRIDIAPARLAVLTGLAADTAVTIALHQLRIPDSHVNDFAQASRLTPEEVARLCLDSLRDRYPPLELNYPSEANFVRRSKTLPSARGWLLTTSSRYCPDCLAGDGSTIQQAHGGPWRKQWRLAAVFACPTHRRLLRHRCPRCTIPALTRSGTNPGLIPAAMITQHPAQCRNVMRQPNQRGKTPAVCAHRLDRILSPRAEPDERLRHLLEFQTRLLRHLHLDDTAPNSDRDRARQHFYDLSLLTKLVRASWPLAADFAPPTVDLDTISDHLDELQREMTQVRETSKPVSNLPLHAGPPEDPLACGHLLALAEHLRTSTDDGLAEVIAAMPGDMTWVRQMDSMLHNCSTALQAAARSHVEALTPPNRLSRRGTVQGRTQQHPPVRLETGPEFDHRRISHYLDEQHTQPLRALIPPSAVDRRCLHRYAAISAVRAATGCSINAATLELDLPPLWGRQASRLVGAWVQQNSTQTDLAAALQAVVDRLNSNPPLTDYKTRRDALRGWTIPAVDWEAITEPLQQAQRATGVPSTTDWGPRKRLVASLLLWTVITRGDYLASPLFRDRSQSHPVDHRFVRLAHRLMFELGRATGPTGRGSHVINLLHALAPYRTRLELAIDSGSFTAIGPTQVNASRQTRALSNEDHGTNKPQVTDTATK